MLHMLGILKFGKATQRKVAKSNEPGTEKTAERVLGEERQTVVVPLSSGFTATCHPDQRAKEKEYRRGIWYASASHAIYRQRGSMKKCFPFAEELSK